VDDINISPALEVLPNGDLKLAVTFRVGQLPFFAKKLTIDDGKGLWFRHFSFELNLNPGETTTSVFIIPLKKDFSLLMNDDFPLPSHLTFTFTDGVRTEIQKYGLTSVVNNAILIRAIAATQEAFGRHTRINILIAGAQGATKTPFINTILHICDEPTSPLIINRGRVAEGDGATICQGLLRRSS